VLKSWSARTRRWRYAGLILILAVALSSRDLALRAVGSILTASDQVERVDLAVTTMESGVAGEIEVSELFHERLAGRVAILSPTPSRIHDELARRGVRLRDDTVDTLMQLGVPPSAIAIIPAGEGGTTDGTEALSRWCRERSIASVLVVVSPTHGRRYRRALRRVWDRGAPLPLVRVARFHPFRAEDWWRGRATRREGIIELQKLTLDFFLHPFS
jgi:hypothetical protein